MPHYNYTTIRAQWDTLPTARAYLGKDETGWVLCLDESYVCVANVPLNGRVLQLDICPLVPASDGAFPTLGAPSQRTVQDWIRSGTLTAVRYGRLLRVRQADLAAFGEVLPRRTPSALAEDVSLSPAPAGAAQE